MAFLNTIPLLSLITFLPLVGAVIVLFLKGDEIIKRFATLWTLIPLVLSILLWFGYDRAAGGFQFEESLPWIPPINV